MAAPEMGEVAHAVPGDAADKKTIESRDHVVIRFAGDSGDGMQLTGMQFATESAIAGNDLATLPDYPAEIRAPAGTLAGVSGYQLNFSSTRCSRRATSRRVLVAMNPAGLKVNIERFAAQRRSDRRQGSLQRNQPEEGGLYQQPAK